MDQPILTDRCCPFCNARLVRYDSGYSEYNLACEPCEAGFVVDGDREVVRSRRWDRKAARGIHAEFPLTALAPVHPEPQGGMAP